MDKIKGVLFGVAIGDALGGPLEFMSKNIIEEKYGKVTDMIGGGWLDLKIGQTTDDTQMTLDVAYGILEDPINPYSCIGARFIKWINTCPKSVGIACSSVINEAKRRNAISKEDWINISKEYDLITNGQSAGNGALMRTVFPALYYKENASRIAVEIGMMTHYSNISSLCIKCYVDYISFVVNNNVNNPKKLLEDYMKPVREIAINQWPNPTGYVVDSLINAINCIKETTSFEECLIKVINNGGDTDTIAAICGGLLGCIYGYSIIPKRWLDSLDNDIYKQLENLSYRLK